MTFDKWRSNREAVGFTGQGSTRLSSFDEWRAQNGRTSNRGNALSNDDISQLQAWETDSINLIKEIQEKSANWYDESTYQSMDSRLSTYLANADSWREKYSGNRKITSYIDFVAETLSQAKTVVSDGYKTYSQYKSADEYKAALKKWQDYYDTWGHYADKEDFADYSAKGAAIENPTMQEAEGVINLFGWRPGTKEVGNIVTYSRDNYNNLVMQTEGGKYDSVGDLRYKHMKDEEVAIYNYLLGMGDEDKAQEYLDYLEETLNARWGGQIAENINAIDIPVLEDIVKLSYGLGAGVDQFAGGAKQLFTSEQLPTSVTQYASAQIADSLDGFGKYAYSAATTIGNMAPSILVGTLNPVAGAATMGVSAAGNAYGQALDRGYNKLQARAYSTLVGASEAALQYAIGGITKLAGGTGKISAKVLSKIDAIDKSLFRISAKVGWETLKEIGEEELQNYLEPLFRTIIAGEEYDAPTAAELFETAIVTILSTGALEGPGVIAGDVKTSKYYTNTYGNFQRELVDQALEGGDLANPLAQKYKQKLDSGESLTGHQIGRLVEANEQQFNAEDMASIQSAAESKLTELGETGDVKSIASALAKQAKYQSDYNNAVRELVKESVPEAKAKKMAAKEVNNPLTKAEQNLISDSKYGQRVANELNPDNIKSGGYASEWAENIGTNRINAQEYSRIIEAAQQPQETAEVTGEQVAAEAPKAVQAEQTDAVAAPTATIRENQMVESVATGKESLQVGEESSAADGKTIQISSGKEVTPQKITAISNGKAVIQTDSGKISSEDIAFGNADTDLLWRSAVQFNGITPVGANGVIRAYQKGTPVTTYLSGAAQEFKNGYYNLPSGGQYADKLTQSQRAIIYELGQKDAGKNVAKEQARKEVANKKTVTEKSSATVKKGGVYYGYEGQTISERASSGKALNAKQSVGVEFAERLAKSRGITFYFYESYINENGGRVYKDKNGNEVKAENGFYDPSDGSIHIDLNAGFDGKGTVLFTISHELVHFIKDWSPKHFKRLANILMQGYAQKNVPVDTLVKMQQANALEHGRELSYDEAYEEVIADSMETILADGKVMELMRDIEKADKSLGQKIKEFFQDIVQLLKDTINAYRGVDPDTVEGTLVLQMEDLITEIQQVFAEGVYEAGDNYQKADKRKAEGGVKYSNNESPKHSAQADITARYQTVVDQILNMKNTKPDHLVIGYTPDVYTSLGMPSLPFVIGTGHVYSAAKTETEAKQDGNYHKGVHYHGLGADVLKNIYEALEDPVMIISSKDVSKNTTPMRSTHSVVAIVDVGNSQKPLLLPIEITAERNVDGQRMDVNALSSVYTKMVSNLVNEAIALENTGNVGVYYAKKEALTLPGAGVQFPVQLQQSIASKSILHKFSEKVNMNILDATQSQQFKRWFGDWQNDPNKASQIVNEDGTPKVMYHGSPAQFSIFEKSKAKSSGLYGKGFYFTDSHSQASVYGNTYSVYLNIKHPLQHGSETVNRSQVQKFLKAVAENEDYSIENYGTYDIPNIMSTILEQESEIDAFRLIQDVSATAIGDMVEAVELFNKVNGTKFDGIIAPTETVVFKPEQIKSATDNIGTFDGNNPDIRYSVRKKLNTSVTDLLQQENEKLKEDVQHLKDLLKLQRTVTGGTKFTKTSVEAAARMLKKDANVRGDTAELTKLLNSFYEGIATDKELSWESVREKAKPAVEWLQRHTEVKPERSEYAKDILNHLRTSRIYLDDTQMQEAIYRYGSYDAYRKMTMGSIILAKEGSVPLDAKWQELSAMYPDVFDAETSSADMPEALVEAISRLRNSDTTVLEYEYHKDLIAQDLLRQVYDSYWRVSTLRTFADSKQREVNKLKAQHYQRMDKLRADNAAQIEQMKIDHRAAVERINRKHRQQMEKQQAELRQQYKESKKKAIETRDKREAREKLQKIVLDTVKWITYPSKTDVKCPDILKQPYADFLNSIDLSSQRLANGGDPTKNDLRLTNAMSSLATALERVMVSQDPTQDATAVLDTGYLDLPANFVQKLRDMTEDVIAMMGNSEYVVNRMPAEDVRRLTQMIRTLNHAIKEVSTLYANLRFANVEALGDNTMSFVDALGEIEKTGGIKDFVQWDNALPYYAFKRFGEGGESIFEGLMDAQDKLAFLAQKIFDFRDKAWTGKEAKAWSEDTHKIDLPDGEALTLTTADAMSIYCLSRRQQGWQHLLGGGTRVIGLQKGSQKAKDSRSLLTVKDVDTIISSLTDRQKQVADAIQEFMSTVCSEWGNEISMKRFLTKEFNEKFYFPIESNDENLSTKDPSAQQSDLFRLLNISATKPIDPRANNEVIIRNIFDVFTSHASDMARLNAYGMALLDYMKWLNYREKTINEEGQIKVRGVRKSMERAYGNAARSYVLNLVKDVNGRPSDGGDPTILMKWMRTAKTASVGNSIRVATLQITSYPRAALVLSPKSLALGLSKLPKIEKAKKYCGVALWKSFGFYDTNISRSIEEQMKGVKDVKQKLIELSLKGAELGDAITWGALWNACEYEVASTKEYKVGTEEFYQAVAKKLREVVYRTQVVDSTLTRSQMMRSKRGMAQEAAAFMSEPTLSANILMDAGFQFSAEKRRSGSVKVAWQKTGKYITRAVAVYSIGQLAAALLEGLWDAWRDDDDEEFGEKYLNAFVENLALDLVPFNKIPIVSDVFEAALAMFGVGFYSSDKMSTTWLTQAVSAADAWKKVLGGESSTTAYNALYKTVRAISSFYGVSFSGVMREGVALWNNTAGASDTTLKIRQYELSNNDLGAELYNAIISGNSKQADSLKAQFEDPKAMTSAIRKALRENDPRIKEAAQAQINGDPSERVRIAKQIVADGFTQDDVVEAINAEINSLTSAGSNPSDTKKVSGYYNADDFAREIVNGDTTAANTAKEDIIETSKKNGKTQEEAEESFTSSVATAFRNLYEDGEIDSNAAMNYLTTYCGMDENDAYWKIQEWEYEVENDDEEFKKYNNFYTAVETGKNLKTVIKEYTDNGVEAKTLASQITKYFKPKYITMTNRERANIKGYLLNAYVLLGYDRTKKSNDIDKWLED